MRFGKNPLRHKPGAGFPPLVAAVITHLPDNDEPYHAQRMDVVTNSLTMMREFAGEDVQPAIMVWDNGSGAPLRRWLAEEYRPEYLFFSENVGKASARSAIMKMLPPETIVALADDDMFYYPGWLSESVMMVNHFPPAVVTAYPCRSLFRVTENNQRTLEWVRDNAYSVQTGNLMPEHWQQEYADSVQARTVLKEGIETAFVWNDVHAFAVSHHCQFTTRAGYLAGLSEWDDLHTTGEHPFDHAIDQAGILRLATIDRLAKHIGNVLEPKVRREMHDLMEGRLVSVRDAHKAVKA